VIARASHREMELEEGQMAPSSQIRKALI